MKTNEFWVQKLNDIILSNDVGVQKGKSLRNKN